MGGRVGRGGRLIIYLVLLGVGVGGIAWWRRSVARNDISTLPDAPELRAIPAPAAKDAEEEQKKKAPAAALRRDAEYWPNFPRQKGRTLVGHTDGSLDLSVSADGSRVLTASVDGTARLWDGVKLLQTLSG